MKKHLFYTFLALAALNIGLACTVGTPYRPTGVTVSDSLVDSVHVKVSRYPDGTVDSVGYKHDRIVFKYRNGKPVKYTVQ